MINIDLYQNQDGSLDGRYKLGDKPAPNTAFFSSSFSGANGDTNTSEFSGIDARRYYSTEQALAPSTSSMRFDALTSGNFFGGTLIPPQGGWPILAEGDTLWVRWYQYIPSTFCAGYGTTPADGWGTTKWLRIQWGEAGVDPSYSRLTAQLSNFSSGACSTGPTFRGCSLESFGSTGDAWFPTQSAIPQDQWVAMQFAIYIHPTNGWVRGWMDDTYLGQDNEDTSPDALAYGIHSVTVGDYWNGSPHQDSHFYIQEIIMTSDTPATTDSGGRPFIEPSVRAGGV